MATNGTPDKKVSEEIVEKCDNSVMNCLKKHWVWVLILVIVVVALVYYFCVHRKKAAAKKAGSEEATTNEGNVSSAPVKVTKNRS
jgi:cell division protein FtsN